MMREGWLVWVRRWVRVEGASVRWGFVGPDGFVNTKGMQVVRSVEFGGSVSQTGGRVGA